MNKKKDSAAYHNTGQAGKCNIQLTGGKNTNFNENLEGFHLDRADDDRIVDVDTYYQLSGASVPNVHAVLEAICTGLGPGKQKCPQAFSYQGIIGF